MFMFNTVADVVFSVIVTCCSNLLQCEPLCHVSQKIGSSAVAVTHQTADRTFHVRYSFRPLPDIVVVSMSMYKLKPAFDACQILADLRVL